MSLKDPPQYQYASNLPQKDWFTPKEVAGYIGRCADTIIRWVNNGSLKATRILGRIYIPRQELLRLLNEGA